ncbi:MAG: DUF433 domain-containing protein [Okeania sp. SIO3C4]|nr:DUF433 domain-containing protein [Okeania sp. SIO3B3]NER05192.1 DUF433 domain-containing protein [Okeania sp. SIO3C4]
MTLKDLEPQLLALTPAEKAQVIQLLAESFANTWSGMEKTPGVCGGDISVGTRIPVWVLVNYGNLGTRDTEILQCYPTLGISDLKNAWSYTEANAKEIERAIEENEEA